MSPELQFALTVLVWVILTIGAIATLCATNILFMIVGIAVRDRRERRRRKLIRLQRQP
jgi:hypothetical protein